MKVSQDRYGLNIYYKYLIGYQVKAITLYTTFVIGIYPFHISKNTTILRWKYSGNGCWRGDVAWQWKSRPR